MGVVSRLSSKLAVRTELEPLPLSTPEATPEATPDAAPPVVPRLGRLVPGGCSPGGGLTTAPARGGVMAAIAAKPWATKRRRDHEARGSSVPAGAFRRTEMMTSPSMAALLAPFW